MIKAQNFKYLKFKSACSQPKLLSLSKFPRALTEVMDIVGEYSLRQTELSVSHKAHLHLCQVPVQLLHGVKLENIS